MTWGVAPGWDGGAPLALEPVSSATRAERRLAAGGCEFAVLAGLSPHPVRSASVKAMTTR